MISPKVRPSQVPKLTSRNSGITKGARPRPWLMTSAPSKDRVRSEA